MEGSLGKIAHTMDEHIEKHKKKKHAQLLNQRTSYWQREITVCELVTPLATHPLLATDRTALVLVRRVVCSGFVNFT